MLRKSTNKIPLHAVIVPGLFSPRWMVRPMAAYLRRHVAVVDAWDHPVVFGEMDRNVRTVGQYLEHIADRSMPTAVITHSFGDWIMRQAIDRYPEHQVGHWVSIGPVVTDNRSSKWVGRLTGDSIPEIAIMRDAARAGSRTKLPSSVLHLVLWPKLDVWIRRGEYLSDPVDEIDVWATHNSALFQYGVWRTVRDFLRCRAEATSPPKSAQENFRFASPEPLVGSVTCSQAGGSSLRVAGSDRGGFSNTPQ